jgi:transketolase
MSNNNTESKIKELNKIAAEARHAMVDTLIAAGCGHPGGAFSSIDVMTALYFDILKVDSKNPKWKDRDYFILSKGHSSVGLYSILALKGFFDKKLLKTFRQDDSILCGHPDKNKVPGIEMSTGSLGHGLSVGVGLALSCKLDNKKNKVFVLMGDGETQEGSVWEAAMSASNFELDNLVGIVDRNMIQIDGFTEDIMALEPYSDKWKAFGWEVSEINGHNMSQIITTLKSTPFKSNKPSLIISNTTKGKGISFMENKAEWHGKALKGKDAEIAKNETSKLLEEFV